MSLSSDSHFLHRLSRYVNSVQRNRPRAIWKQVVTFPPIPSAPHPSQLVILCEAAKFTDGLWAAWSWLRFLHPYLRLHLFVDGPISDPHRASFERLFPGAELSSVPVFLNAQPSLPANLRKFVDHHLFARKMAMLLHLQKTASVLYCDCDVLAFQSPEAIIAAIKNGARNLYMIDPAGRFDQTCVDPWMRNRAAQLSLPCLPCFNAGFLWITQNSIDPALVEKLLDGWTPAVNHHFAEQTLFAVLFALNQATPLDENSYVLSAQGMHFWETDLDCRQLIVRHYVGLVRHRMYAEAYPFIASQAKRARAALAREFPATS